MKNFKILLVILSAASLSCDAEEVSKATAGLKIDSADDSVRSIAQAGHWPSFRGPYASGVAEGQNLPNEWNGESMKNIKWKSNIPGLAHSSPVIWGQKLFVTTAISALGDHSIRHGLYGDGDASPDRGVQTWDLICLNKKTGGILWQRTAIKGIPKDKRHIKATYANSSPATDGQHVVAWFGSEGLFCFDLQGNMLWQKALGRLNIGAYDLKEYEWGSASSAIIYRNMVIVQCDTQDEDFIIACDIRTGKTVWKTDRDELPSWGTPTIYPSEKRTVLVTNGSNFIRGYNPITGRELWRLGGSSKITAPSPVFAHGLFIVASGRRPEKPIFAIRAGATGDITLNGKQTSNEYVAWSKTKRGPYMPTPLIFGGYVYTLNNNGVFDCYDLATGNEIYRQRIRHSGGGFSASPVAADGKIYLSGEDGDMFVVQAGPKFELIAKNEIGEIIMATPALSDGMMYVRAKDHVFVIGK